jgi:ATP-binding cassette ChvD family protein
MRGAQNEPWTSLSRSGGRLGKRRADRPPFEVPMNQQYIFTMAAVTKRIGRRPILEQIWLAFYPGAKIGVLGRNGAGKSTLLRIMAGQDTEFEGEARLTPGYTRDFLPQEPQLTPEKNVRENVEEAVAPRRAILDRYHAINDRLAETADPGETERLCDELAHVQDRIDAGNLWTLDQQIEVAMDAMNLPDPDTPASVLSGGERRRVALCRLLLGQPDLLLLDEPTNHLDANAVAWLEHHLANYPGTVVAVTHDRYFLDNVARWILELDRGKGIPWEGNYSSWLEQKQERLSCEEKANTAREKSLKRELEWIRMAPRARQAKSKARIRAYDELARQEFRDVPEELEIQIPPGRRLGELVLEAVAISKSYGNRQLIENLSFHLPPGGIVGVIGPNGAGKTTLFRMICGEETPDSGTVRMGPTVELGYVNQDRDALVPEHTVFQEIAGGQETFEVNGRKIVARAYVARFNFRGPDQEKKVGDLSGGERNRVHLAKLLRKGSNLLLLDEPTNDLDIDTLRALEEAILQYPGCAMVISHDRWFLDRIATHILAFEGDAHVHWCEGNYQTYEQQRCERLGISPDAPPRFRYKKLHR